MTGYYFLLFIIAVGLGVIVGKLYMKSKNGAGTKKQNPKITKDTKIGELLAMNADYAKVLTNQGMHCVGCPSAQGETLAEAAAVHHMDLNKLLNALWNM